MLYKLYKESGDYNEEVCKTVYGYCRVRYR